MRRCCPSHNDNVFRSPEFLGRRGAGVAIASQRHFLELSSARRSEFFHATNNDMNPVKFFAGVPPCEGARI
jgi:hypothetical protein